MAYVIDRQTRQDGAAQRAANVASRWVPHCPSEVLQDRSRRKLDHLHYSGPAMARNTRAFSRIVGDKNRVTAQWRPNGLAPVRLATRQELFLSTCKL